MLKALLREKKLFVAVAGIVSVALLVAVLAAMYVFASPKSAVKAYEASPIVSEPHNAETAKEADPKTEDIEEKTPIPSESETLADEEDSEQEVIEEADVATGEKPDENGEDESNGKEKEEGSAEQPQYIGRQPPEGYVEPESVSYKAQWISEYKDTYQSNIVVIQEEIWGIDYRDYAWFHPAYHVGRSTSGVGAYQFLVYAILTYYDGDVPCDYYVSFREDVHNGHPRTSMIFEVQTHGDRPLNICLDMYNWKIRVEEGIVKED